MILTDREIELALRTRRIRIDPEPGREAYSSTSIDLTLGQHVRHWIVSDLPGEETVISPGTPGYRFNELAQKRSRLEELGSAGHVLKPQCFLLAWTMEIVSLPAEHGLAARVEGKSSLARLGIGIHVTAPTIHAGFTGQIQLEMFNFGPLSVRLVPGMRVCQLIFEQSLGTPEKGYSGMFANQSAAPI